MFTVITAFPERLDGGHKYAIGDNYPREGFAPPEGRAEALCVGKPSEMNRTGVVYLKAAEKTPAKTKRSQKLLDEGDE